MPRLQSSIFKIVAALSVFATAVGAGATASAGGYYGGFGGYYGHGGGFYAAHHRGFRGGYRRGYHRGYRHRRGANGAAIALGVIGGAIILSEAARASERRRYEEERRYRDYYDDRYDRYRQRRYDRYDEYDRWDGRQYDRDENEREWRRYDFDRDDERVFEEEAPASGATRDDRPVRPSDDIDDILEGGPDDDQDRPPVIVADRAFAACMRHAAGALGDQGLRLYGPDRPDTAEDRGETYRVTARVTARNARGERWRRDLVCDATGTRVYRLELI